MISHLPRRCTSLHIHSSSTVFLTTESHAITITVLYQHDRLPCGVLTRPVEIGIDVVSVCTWLA
jgi:hypothetical protein